MKTVSFHTLGCKVNFAETSTLARQFEAAGFVRVGRSDDDEQGGGIPAADVYIVNSCSVTAAADKKCRNLIAGLHRRSPGALIAVTGCYAQLAPERLAAIEGVGLVFGNNFKGDITESVADYLRANDSRPENIAEEPGSDCSSASGSGSARCLHSSIEGLFPAYSAGDRTRSFLKVQDGCDYKCAYCTIHYARGSSRNVPIDELLRQAREIASKGVKEIVLTGINTGDFGRTTGESFPDLLRALDAVEGIERYRISSIEPNLLTDEIIDFCASSSKFQPHFHIPLQSGSDRILGLMRRRYTTAVFADRLARVRSVMPEVFFGVDVIAGFPGESDADFDETLRFVEKVRPAELHVFPYSERPGTPAAQMPGKVSPKIAAERAARLGDLGSRLHAEFTAAYAGTRARVLFESGRKGGEMCGFTANYIKVCRPYDAALVGEIVEVIL